MSDLNTWAVTIRRGTDVEIQVTVLDADGEPANLDGVDLHYRVAVEALSAKPLLSVDRPAITHESNVATVPVTSDQTRQLPAGNLYHELFEVIDGKVSLLRSGNLTVKSAQAALHEVA
jgi:hypothetical protein